MTSRTKKASYKELEDTITGLRAQVQSLEFRERRAVETSNQCLNMKNDIEDKCKHLHMAKVSLEGDVKGLQQQLSDLRIYHANHAAKFTALNFLRLACRIPILIAVLPLIAIFGAFEKMVWDSWLEAFKL